MSDIETTFLEAIRANPEDDDARRVYADWLEERGDARGEYLRLEIMAARGPQRLAELATRIDPRWLREVGRRYRLVLEEARNKIAAIKMIREITGFGLKDAKDLVDAGHGTVLVQRLELEQARAYAKRFEPDATVRIEADVSSSEIQVPQPANPSPKYTVTLVAIIAAREADAFRYLREVRPELPGEEARQLVERVVAGTPEVVRVGLVGGDALRIADRFAYVARTRIERDP
jgi:uncharacterized protein (TIGR02996 family)